MYPVSAEVLKIDGEGPGGPDNQHRVPESHQSDQWGFDFNSNPNSFGEDRQVSEVYSKREQDDLSAYPANSNVDYDVNLFESKDAVTGITPNLEVMNQFDIILLCIMYACGTESILLVCRCRTLFCFVINLFVMIFVVT